MNEFAKLLRAKFAAGLQAKTGWGRNEIQRLFDQCAAEAAIEVASAPRQATAMGNTLTMPTPLGCPRCGAYPSNGLCCGR